MKSFIFLIFLSFLTTGIQASTDDSLPEGVASRILVFPFVLRSPETSWGFGAAAAFFFKAGKEDDGLRTSDVNLVSLYTLRKQTVVVLGSTVFFPGEKQVFRFQGSYSYYPDKYWGMGNESEENLKTDYSLKQFFINPQFIINVYRKLFFGISLEWQDISNFSYPRGSVFDFQQTMGRQGGVTVGAGLLFTFDTRNNAYSPSRGTFFEINATDFNRAVGSDFNFISYIVDARKFLALTRSTVLGLQSVTRINHGEAPIRNLSMLGGPEMMRGYYKGRYTDRNLFALQSEIRQYLFWRLGIVGFASAGQVSRDVDEFNLNKFHFAYGAGLRIMMHEKEKLNLRVDFGFGKKSSGVYVLLKESF